MKKKDFIILCSGIAIILLIIGMSWKKKDEPLQKNPQNPQNLNRRDLEHQMASQKLSQNDVQRTGHSDVQRTGHSEESKQPGCAIPKFKNLQVQNVKQRQQNPSNHESSIPNFQNPQQTNITDLQLNNKEEFDENKIIPGLTPSNEIKRSPYQPLKV